ncbi:MAG: hypothetical protein WBG71_05860 [Leeuwenhoekiella sp.]
MKKYLVLGVLFILPLVAYLFFASGINNFAKLPVLQENIPELDFVEETKLQDKITVLGFLGKNVEESGPSLFNLNQKIYKYFSEFEDFQFVFLLPKGASQVELEVVIKELSLVSNMDHWKFVFAEKNEMQQLFRELKTPYSWNAATGSEQIFIIDKNRNLRGRDDDEDVSLLYGYDYTDVAELANKMKDDVKIILAEYRLALKKNTADRVK